METGKTGGACAADGGEDKLGGTLKKIAGLALSLAMSFVLGAALANIYYHIDPEVSKGLQPRWHCSRRVSA